MPETTQTADQTKAQPDLTSVRTLITSVRKLATHLNVTPSAVYRWIGVNRLPGAHVVNIANFYDVELRDLIPLTGSDNNNKVATKVKPRVALKNLLEVYRGKMTLEDACTASGITIISGKLVLTNWGDELPTLYTTLEQLSEGRIDIEEAMIRLNVSKYTLHGIRRKYGYAPGRRVAKARPERKGMDEDMKREIAYQVISGKISGKDACAKYDIVYGTLGKYVQNYGQVGLQSIAKWPTAFREALGFEALSGCDRFAQSWYDYATEARLMLKKKPAYPSRPKSWKRANLKRLLIAVLVGEATLDEIAAERGGDPSIIAKLFTGELRPLKLTYDRVSGMSIKHQIALAELLMAMADRKRKFAPVSTPEEGQTTPTTGRDSGTNGVMPRLEGESEGATGVVSQGDAGTTGDLFEAATGDSEGDENV